MLRFLGKQRNPCHLNVFNAKIPGKFEEKSTQKFSSVCWLNGKLQRCCFKGRKNDRSLSEQEFACHQSASSFPVFFPRFRGWGWEEEFASSRL